MHHGFHKIYIQFYFFIFLKDYLNLTYSKLYNGKLIQITLFHMQNVQRLYLKAIMLFKPVWFLFFCVTQSRISENLFKTCHDGVSKR